MMIITRRVFGIFHFGRYAIQLSYILILSFKSLTAINKMQLVGVYKISSLNFQLWYPPLAKEGGYTSK